MSIKTILLCAALFSPLFFSVTESSATELSTCTLTFSTPQKTITLRKVPVARTEAEMNIGLSKRKHVQNGMLFSWQTAEPRVFWMQDTWVNLSIGFFDADGVLFDVQAMQANTAQYHYSVQRAKNALELAQGQFKKIGLSVGSKLMQQDCN